VGKVLFIDEIGFSKETNQDVARIVKPDFKDAERTTDDNTQLK
jgi:hypothetical protein